MFSRRFFLKRNTIRSLTIAIISPVAPKIDRRNLRDITISAGSMVKFDVDVSGEPAPTTKWTKEGFELKYVLSVRRHIQRGM